VSHAPSRWLTCLLFTLATIGVAACGSDDESSTTAGPVPEATESVAEFGERFAAAGDAAAAGDCDAVDDFNAEAGFTVPCEPGYDGLKVTGSADFGSAAVIDYTSAGNEDGATAIAALNEDGRFRLMQSLVPASIDLDATQSATEPTQHDIELRDQQAQRFVDAVRAKDCDAYFEAALTPTQDKQKECSIEFAPKTGIQPDLEDDPDAAPQSLGNTEAFGLYGLETADHYRVLLAVRNYGPDEHDPDPADAYVVTSYRSQD